MACWLDLEKEWPDFWGERTLQRFFKACSWSSLSGECDLENGRRFFEQPPFFVSARLRAQNGKLALVDSSSGLARPQGLLLPKAPELTALRKLMSFYHLCVFQIQCLQRHRKDLVCGQYQTRVLSTVGGSCIGGVMNPPRTPSALFWWLNIFSTAMGRQYRGCPVVNVLLVFAPSDLETLYYSFDL